MSSLPRVWRAAVAACAAVFAAAAASCGGSTDPGEAPVAAIQLSDTALALRLGDDAAIVAQARSAAGEDLVGRRIFWASRDPAVVSVSQSGVISAVGVGTTEVAASTEGKTAKANVTVLARPLATLQADPATLQLVVSERRRLTVRALNDAGAPVAAAVTWTSLDPGVVSVSADGEVVALAPGVGSVRAEAEDVTTTAVIVVAEVPVASVSVSPTTASLVVGASRQLTATPKDAAGAPLAGREVSWTSRDPAVAAVSADGEVTGVAPGTASVVATVAGKSATVAVTVTPVAVAAVAVSPRSSSIGVGGTVRLAAVVTDAAGNALTGRTVTFSSSASSVARVGADGLVTGVAPGTATITATSEGRSGTATVRVMASTVVASVAVAPDEATLSVGDTRTLVATPRTGTGSPVTGRPVEWSSSSTRVVTVSSTGVVRAMAPGTAQVLAEVDGVTGTATITVRPVTAASVAVTPPSPNVSAGSSVQLAATPRDAAGNALTGRVVAWSSSDDAVATVTSSGRVVGVAPGTATIRATSDGVTGTATITVGAVIRVSPATVTLRDRGNARRRTAQLVATDHAGRMLPSDEVTWSSSNPEVATVDQNGLVRGVSSQGGTATAVITATYRGASDTATVRVTRDGDDDDDEDDEDEGD